MFLTGTAANVTPVVELDRRNIGTGEPGPITTALQKMYFDVVVGRDPKYLHWCTVVTPEVVPA